MVDEAHMHLATKVLQANIQKCDHLGERKLISTLSEHLFMKSVFELNHPPLDDYLQDYESSAHSVMGEISTEVTAGQILDTFQLKYYTFLTCVHF